MKLRYLAAAFMIISSLMAYGEVEWLSKDYDFGIFKESDGKVTGKVSFVNRGPEATFISRVRPSCGCTGASYTDSMVQPGDTATITFTYNPQGRPGHFDKNVKVYLGEGNDLTVIRIRGTVIGSSATLQSYYPVECGPLRLDNSVVPVGEIKKGRSRHLFMNVYNQGDKSLKPEFKTGSPALVAEINPAEIAPGETATITFFLKTDAEMPGGPFEIPVNIYPEGEKGPKSKVTVNGVIIPDTSTIPIEKLENAPQAFLFPEFVDLGEIKGKSEEKFEFSVLNEGKEPLLVENVYPKSGGIVIKRSPSKVKGGGKGIVKGTVRMSELPDGPFRLKVEVLTTDPLHPVRTCDIVGEKK